MSARALIIAALLSSLVTFVTSCSKVQPSGTQEIVGAPLIVGNIMYVVTPLPNRLIAFGRNRHGLQSKTDLGKSESRS